MKIKTIELKGTALDWAVTKCEQNDVGYIPHVNPDGKVIKMLLRSMPYSTDWALGGAIIEREFIAIESPRAFGWQASMWVDETNPITGHHRFGAGDTPLEASMRCFVSSRLGDEIDVPDELL